MSFLSRKRGKVQQISQVQNCSPSFVVNVNTDSARSSTSQKTDTQKDLVDNKVSLKPSWPFISYDVSWKSTKKSVCILCITIFIVAGFLFFMYSIAGKTVDKSQLVKEPEDGANNPADCNPSILYNELRDNIVSIKEFGTCLGIRYPVLDKINRENNGQVDDGLISLINHWVQSSGIREGHNCWKGIVKAVKCMRKNKLAQELEQKYLKNST